MSGEDWTDDPVMSSDKDSLDEDSLDERLAEMRRLDAQETPRWFLPALAAGLAWVGIGIWLMQELHWPKAYGFRSPCVRGCIFVDIVRSPALLRNPTGASLALFAWYMSAVALLLGIIVHGARTKPRGQYLLLLALIAGGFLVLALSPDGTPGW